ncbi:hypothetical protein COU54_00030 [Candidatus Pacearchaeota archaeon CG10_big_fil_rev_8_21_14_0_10_31_24]|nr:MAG: hypothetical protein COU54_00030 [Candidatus Pacearchaeota archaeon CG10_big_fil_rev_8_21_14_0_10_31_24]
MSKVVFWNHLMNMRVYSWVDLIILGLFVKISSGELLAFSLKDFAMIFGLISLWCFYNLILEWYKARAYRAKPNLIFPVIFVFIGCTLGAFYNLMTLFFSFGSTLLVLLYLLKNPKFPNS